jgi:hypothetical protein
LDGRARANEVSMHIATFQMLSGAIPTDLECFDDGIVSIGASKAANAGLAFGAIGGAASAVAAQRSLKKGRTAADEAGRSTAAALAGALGVGYVSTDQIVAARLEKGFAKARKLTLTTMDGKSVKYQFPANKLSPDEVARAMAQMLGDRFTNTLA